MKPHIYYKNGSWWCGRYIPFGGDTPWMAYLAYKTTFQYFK